jgi:hypothetical protein
MGGFHGGGFHGAHFGGDRRGFRRGGFDGWWGGGLGWGYDSDYGYSYPGYDYGAYDAYGAYGYNQPSGSQVWYYCQNPAGYYPYVSQCTTAWQPVPAG